MNAKEEFINHIKDRKVKCTFIIKHLNWNINKTDYDKIKFNLPISYNEKEYEEFLKSLDFEYKYGSQLLQGYIWYEDNTWSERGEYDSSEWWEHKEIPEIPEELLK